MKDFLSVQSEMLTTLKDFQASLRKSDPEPPIAGPSSQGLPSSSRPPKPPGQCPKKPVSSDSEDSEGTLQDEGMAESQGEEEEDEDAKSGKYIFSADDMDGLLSAIYASEEIPHTTEQVSAQDRMYQGLTKPQSKTIPVHQSLKDTIRREWAEPEKKLPKFKTWKRRCPFKEDVEDTFFKVPRLDAALAQVSRQSDLSFEDTGNLKDAMDRRADTSLRRAWEANAAALGPALASVCVARNTAAWTSKLLDHVASSSESGETRDSLQVIGTALAYLADAALETVRATAKSGALINASRRAVWLKTWGGRSRFQKPPVCYSL